MRVSGSPRVKVCCIRSVAEARLAVACGASALGLVSAMPSGPGAISDEEIRESAALVPPLVATFLLTARLSAEEIVDQHVACGTNTLQLVDHVPHAELRKLRAWLPGIKLVQVIHVTGVESIEQAEAAAPLVDALLLDSGRPTGPLRELGGTGRTHDWTLSRQIRERSNRPVFLAGGLTPANVAQAITAVAPFALDLCTGVRTGDALDETKLRAFFAAASA